MEKEHRALLAGATRGDSTVSLQSSEEKALRGQRARLEARMAILEDHNRQLEAQVFTSTSYYTNKIIVIGFSLFQNLPRIPATIIESRSPKRGGGRKVKPATFCFFLIAKLFCIVSCPV